MGRKQYYPRYKSMGMTKQPHRERPLGVTVIGVLLLLAGLITILSSVLIDSFEDLENIEVAVVVASFVIGLIYLIAAYGFFKGWSWIWLVTMVVVVLGILVDIVAWAIGGFDDLGGLLLGLIIPVIIVLYMNSQNVKAFFRRA